MIFRLVHAINRVNEKVGHYISYIFIPLTAICLIEVTMRYVFNRPTVWAWDVEKQLFGILTVMGAGYTLLYKSHVSIDIFVQRFSPRTRAKLKLITTSLTLLTLLIVIHETSKAAIDSVNINELSSSYWIHPLYPVKIGIALGVILLFIQSISQFLSVWMDNFKPERTD
jgi:TRAP-type mannitol/chloroaromatic compound transport system permease small subunit